VGEDIGFHSVEVKEKKKAITVKKKDLYMGQEILF